MKDLIIPEGIKVLEESKKYGKYLFAPLERGFGITVGNSMRRVLLSSIPGQAIYAVKIEGVLHEFSTIKGVIEDVPLIVLNLKRIRLKFGFTGICKCNESRPFNMYNNYGYSIRDGDKG